MAKIITKELIAPQVYEMVVDAPLVAHKCKPGQFVIVRTDEFSERVPLTIADFNREAGTITLIIQAIGNSTHHLCEALGVGDDILDVVGPLGRPSEMEKFGTVVVVGGGIGVAPVYPIARAMHEAGNKVISIMGAKTKDILIFEDKMRAISDEVLIATDDGSYGVKGFVTTALQQLVDRGEKIDQVTAIGPGVMMRSVVEATRPLGIKTIVSLNPVMVDGTGMCGGCRVQVGDEMKFACVDGPEFDGHLVDFDSLMSRSRMFRPQEAQAKDHVCNIGLGR